MISIATYAPVGDGHVVHVRVPDSFLSHVEIAGLPTDDTVNLFASVRGAAQ